MLQHVPVRHYIQLPALSAAPRAVSLPSHSTLGVWLIQLFIAFFFGKNSRYVSAFGLPARVGIAVLLSDSFKLPDAALVLVLGKPSQGNGLGNACQVNPLSSDATRDRFIQKILPARASSSIISVLVIPVGGVNGFHKVGGIKTALVE